VLWRVRQGERERGGVGCGYSGKVGEG